MTTIACNRREMACDSRQSGDELYFRVSDKVVHINGHLVGCCGDVDQIFKFIAWFREDAPANPPKFADTFGAVVLTPSRHIHYYGGCGYPTLVGEPFFAIGSGALAALAAMTCGKSPREAVRVACRHDKNSGPPVRAFMVNDADTSRK